MAKFLVNVFGLTLDDVVSEDDFILKATAAADHIDFHVWLIDQFEVNKHDHELLLHAATGYEDATVYFIMENYVISYADAVRALQICIDSKRSPALIQDMVDTYNISEEDLLECIKSGDDSVFPFTEYKHLNLSFKGGECLGPKSAAKTT
jgi:hypothetical protein